MKTETFFFPLKTFDASVCCSRQVRLTWSLADLNICEVGEGHKTIQLLINWELNGGFGYLIKQYFL